MNTTQLSAIQTTPATLPLERIHVNPINPRAVREAERAELADSLKAVGQLSRLWVRPHADKPGEYALVDGERRWWGAKAAGLSQLDVQIGNWTDEHVVVIALTTGTKQKKLDPIAEARGFKTLRGIGRTVRDIAATLDVSPAHVSQSLAVIDAPEVLAVAVATRGLPLRTAYELSSVDASQLGAAIDEVLEPTLVGNSPLAHPAAKELARTKYAKPRPDPVVAEGQKALTREESMKVFPVGAEDPDPASGFVAYSRPIPPDLIKPEVAATAPVKFSDVAKAAQVYVGVDSAGRSVEVVKLSEAMAAVEPEDRHVFREEVAKGAGIPKPERAAGEPPSRRVEEEIAERERKKAEKQQRKKDRAVAEWLGELGCAIRNSHAHARLPFWSLMFERALDQLSADDIAFVGGFIFEDASADEKTREAVIEYAGKAPLGEMITLTTAMFLVPRLRLEGVNGELVKAWHAALVDEPKPTEPEAVAFQSLPPEEAAKLTSVAKAHAAGMSPLLIARQFQMTLVDVCGALELDPKEAAAELDTLDDDLSAALHAAGVKQDGIGGAIKLALGREVSRADLVPEEIRKVLEMLSRVASAKAPKPAAPVSEKE